MRQQVNLYQPIFRRERRVFSAVTIAQAAALVVAGLALMYGYARAQLAQLETERARLEAQVAERAARVERLARQYPPRRRDEALARRVAALERELEAKRELAEGLEGGRFGNAQGLSPYLEALARRRVNGLWLRTVAVGDGGAALLLEGSALDARLVPRLVQALGREPAYAGRAFERLVIERPRAAPRRVDFRLRVGEVRLDGGGGGR